MTTSQENHFRAFFISELLSVYDEFTQFCHDHKGADYPNNPESFSNFIEWMRDYRKEET